MPDPAAGGTGVYPAPDAGPDRREVYSMKGLLIKEPWITLILEGKKTWEIRGANTKTRGRIALIRSGSGLIVGTAELTDVIGPLTLDDLKRHRSKHQAPLDLLDRGLRYRTTFAWVLNNARPLKKPKPYQHPQGAVVWVDLEGVRL
jgi:hypothetical protein